MDYVNFYEGPLGQGPEIDDRVYMERFSQPDTAAIFYELNLLHMERTAAIDFTINAKYYFPDGSKMGEFAWESRAEADWTSSWHSAGYGWEETGNWQVGRHKIEIYINDELVYTGWFEIYQ